MTFIRFFRLYRRDPHQLFELLCFQLRNIAITYSEGFKDIIKPKSDDESETPTYNPVELLNCEYTGKAVHNYFCVVFTHLVNESTSDPLLDFTSTQYCVIQYVVPVATD